MNLIDKYRFRKLLKLRKDMERYEADIKYINENEQYHNKKEVEELKDDFFTLMAITNEQMVKLVDKLGDKIKEFEK